MKKVLRWEMWGTVLIIILGTLLHFVYEWSGETRLIAIFGAVNESVWEHLKLTFWPAVLWAIIEMPFLKREYPNFWFAKAVGILAMPLIIVMIFYSYTSIVGRTLLVVDLLSFVIAVLVGQFFETFISQSCATLVEWSGCSFVSDGCDQFCSFYLCPTTFTIIYRFQDRSVWDKNTLNITIYFPKDLFHFAFVKNPYY